MTTPREFADRFHARWLATNPLEANTLGVPGYDDQVPDPSDASISSWRAQAETILGQARALDAEALSTDNAVTLGVLVEHAEC